MGTATWRALFDRAAEYGATERDVRAALADRRGGTDAGDGDRTGPAADGDGDGDGRPTDAGGDGRP
ncbi:MAG: hypothetical protein ABEH40_03580 [Haloferacaceae archaeon]